METLAWIILFVILALSLAVDLVAHRGTRATSTKAATLWTGIWLALGMGFGAVVFALRGSAAMQDYYAAYLVEESLSVDNLFVFLLIFRALAIPAERQHGVLFYGVLGALGFRALFVIAGAAALERWQWINFVFGGLLLIAAVRAAAGAGPDGESRAVTWLSRHLPVTPSLEGSHFVVRRNSRLVATPLLLALIGLELSDIFFALDSVPAALAVSHDRFVVYASNALAICGLRALYLVLGNALGRLPHLHYGIAGVLLFTGAKMIAKGWFEIPSWASIIVVTVCIGGAVGWSLAAQRREGEASA